jgi:hypothetical protein
MLVHQNPLQNIIMKISRKTKSKIGRCEEVKELIKTEDLKNRDLTQICNFGRISGAIDKGIANRAH